MTVTASRLENFAIDLTTANNSFSAAWGLTRCMKAAGWNWMSGSSGSVAASTVAAGSNGVALPTGTINVASTAGMPSQGAVKIGTINTIVHYTGITATTITGCTGGAGTLATGQTVTAWQATSAVAANDPWGGNVNPLADTYAGTLQAIIDTRAAWWCAEGPSTVKLGITAASSGTFRRGESVSQATSGATGEILGYVINSAANSGWVVIMPRTGTFNGTDTITGADSGATVTATSYTLFRRQIVIAKNTTVTAGWIFYQCISAAEITAGGGPGAAGTALFSDLAQSTTSSISQTQCPGNGTVTNLFPATGIAVIGSGAGGAGASLFDGQSLFAKAQIVAVNATPSAGISADGSFFAMLYNTQGNGYGGPCFMRFDDGEPGDVDPFGWWCQTSESITTVAGRTAGTPASTFRTYASFTGAGGVTPVKGYCARGTGTMGTGVDDYVGFNLGCVSENTSSATSMVINASSVARIRNHPDSLAGSPPSPLEAMTAFSQRTNLSMIKGRARWLAVVPSGASVDTYDTKQWMVVIPQASSTNPAVVIGPLDGSTTPSLT